MPAKKKMPEPEDSGIVTQSIPRKRKSKKNQDEALVVAESMPDPSNPNMVLAHLSDGRILAITEKSIAVFASIRLTARKYFKQQDFY